MSDHSSDSFDSIRNIEFKTYALEDQAEMNPTPSLWQQQSNMAYILNSKIVTMPLDYQLVSDNTKYIFDRP